MIGNQAFFREIVKAVGVLGKALYVVLGDLVPYSQQTDWGLSVIMFNWKYPYYIRYKAAEEWRRRYSDELSRLCLTAMDKDKEWMFAADVRASELLAEKIQ